MAPGIAQDPAHAQVLQAAATANKGTQGTWSTNFDPKTGMATQIGSNGQTRQFKYATPTKDDKKWGTISHDQYGKPVEGYIPSEEEYAASQTPEAKAAAAAASAAANPQAGLTGKEFMGALAAKDAGYAGRVQATIEGRALLPTGRAAAEGTPGGQFVKDVMQADPNYNQGDAMARVRTNNEFKSGTGPNSPANIISIGNTAMSHGTSLADNIEGFKGAYDNAGGSIPYASYYQNKAHNSTLAGSGTPEAQAYQKAEQDREHFGEEVSKYYGGGVAGEAAKQRSLANLDFAKSLPELRAAMHEEMSLIHGKVSSLQERWHNGMNNSALVPDFPLVSKDNQSGMERITSRYNDTAAGPASSATPKTGKFKDVPWSIK
jgi:hypothetical protein